ncbi:hypothetical protein AQ436_16555 [Arthrobacter sp. EpRS66]|nr:hypothetical protein AQ436_16555 [Arthrobacter sp. EpRS66]
MHALKTEFYDRCRYATRAEAKRKAAWWIWDFYIRRRLHLSLGMVPPVEIEQQIRELQGLEQARGTILTLAAELRSRVH